MHILLIVELMLHRLTLIYRTNKLVRKTNAPEWKALRLSAIEPLITTLFISIWLCIWLGTSVDIIEDDIDLNFDYAYAGAEWVLWYGIIVVLVCNLALFAWSIRKVSQGSQRSRLALGTIYARLGLIALSVLFGLLGYFNETIFALPFYALFIAFIIRVVSSIYQTVPLTKNQELLEKGSALIEDGLVDEQNVLIERLKADEVTAEPQPVGRVQEYP